MNSRFVAHAAVMLLLLMALGTLQAQDKQVSVLQFVERMPIGKLGAPLGERLVIEGSQFQVMVNNAIEVTAVNGNHLENPVVIELKGIEKIKPNISYKLEGYESGAFEGDPFNEAAQIAYGYHAFFVVTKVLIASK